MSKKCNYKFEKGAKNYLKVFIRINKYFFRISLANLMRIPNNVEELWNKYNLHERVREHCKAVANLSVRIAKEVKRRGHDVDVNAVLLGALLHDIGRAISNDPFQHFLRSAEILRREGFDEKIVRIAERHFGAGISEEDAKKLGLPVKSYMPETIEEKIVSFADNLVFGSKIKSFYEFIQRLNEICNRAPNLKWFTEKTKVRAERLKREIEELSGLKF